MEKHNFRVYGYGPSANKRTAVRWGPSGARGPAIPNLHPLALFCRSATGIYLITTRGKLEQFPSYQGGGTWQPGWPPRRMSSDCSPGDQVPSACVCDNGNLQGPILRGERWLWHAARQATRPPGRFCRTHKTLTWVFHLVMVQEAQGLQGIALGVPLQQPRGATLT